MLALLLFSLLAPNPPKAPAPSSPLALGPGLGDLTLRTLDGNGDWDAKFDFNGAAYKSTRVKGAPESLDLDRFGGRLELQHSMPAEQVVSLGFEYERLAYGNNYMLGGTTAPLHSADHWRVDATWFGAQDAPIPWFASARAEAGLVDGAKPLDELTFGGNLGATVPLMEHVGVKLVIDVNERHEDDVRILPLALLDWRISEAWHLGDQAGGWGLGFQGNPATNYFLSVNLEERGYRLGKESGAPDAAIYDEELSLRGGMVWHPNPGLKVDLFVGLAERELELRDDGEGLGTIETDDALFGGIRLSLGTSYLK
ncbi:MAG: hypothetical protein P8N31_13120 [Planctomycetota bacterium]|nr:hypothetical protein [Planctomycetota bacterium]MDG2144488.1 hypothetical protein [Planctomycetota bacterium]